jgi:hypothetical protein
MWQLRRWSLLLILYWFIKWSDCLSFSDLKVPTLIVENTILRHTQRIYSMFLLQSLILSFIFMKHRVRPLDNWHRTLYLANDILINQACKTAIILHQMLQLIELFLLLIVLMLLILYMIHIILRYIINQAILSAILHILNINFKILRNLLLTQLTLILLMKSFFKVWVTRVLF